MRNSLDTWLTERRTWPQADEPALFLSRRGQRLTVRAVHDILTTIADAAGIPIGRDADFTPHVLRHTAGTTMTRAGTDIVTVAELLGHSVETARRYSLPSRQDRQAARPPSNASPPTPEPQGDAHEQAQDLKIN
ncbi:tyrosine-type recombinase/integrase [Embleya sp. NPDC005575]|uniref:tyrosine-type recombinase/integrase n=1 Tax=Embleya sp. NPDC005575 TaxID=3156892 RepID=UPI0033BAA2A5